MTGHRSHLAEIPGLLAREGAGVIVSFRHGLRLGEARLRPFSRLPSALRAWTSATPQKEGLLQASHLSAAGWRRSLLDPRFPRAFLRAGGRLHEQFVRVLFVNSFAPSLRFVRPYGPTERLAALLRRGDMACDALVYDPNLEPKRRIRQFPAAGLRLWNVLAEEHFDFIVQAVYSVDPDLHLLAEIGQRAPGARLVLGGPHLRTVDLAAWFRALPIHAVIAGDGEEPLRELVRSCRSGPVPDVPGLLRPGAERRPVPAASPMPRAPEKRLPFPSIWRLATYESRAGVLGPSAATALPYDMVGLRPWRVLTSQRCGKPCYWCRSPKALAPRVPVDVVAEIAAHFSECDSLHFEDNEIWFAPDNFRRIGRLLVARGLNSKPGLVKTTTDRMTAERAAFLREMGVRIVAFGVESFSQESLDLLGKGTTVEQNHRALELALQAGLKPGINAIWLVPAIDPESTWELARTVIPYLRRGAYLNLVPELEMGDLRVTPHIESLISRGYFRREVCRFPGMRSSWIS